MTDLSNITGQIVLVGAGRMGGAMAAGWLAAGLPADQLVVLDPAIEDDGLFPGAVINPDLEQVVGSDIAAVILAVKPQMMDDVLPGLVQLTGKSPLFLSIAAGRTIQGFEAALGAGQAIIRSMPNTPAAIGKGITAWTRNGSVSDDQAAMADQLLSAIGQTVEVPDESLMDAVTAVSGSGPAYIFHLVEAMAGAGERLGLAPDVAMQLARETVIGSAALLDDQADLSPATLRENVTSPGGTTAAALDVLMDQENGLPALMRRALKAAADRSKELAQ